MEIKITKYDKEIVLEKGKGNVERYSVTVSENGGAYNEPDLSKSQVVAKVLAVLYQEQGFGWGVGKLVSYPNSNDFFYYQPPTELFTIYIQLSCI